MSVKVIGNLLAANNALPGMLPKSWTMSGPFTIADLLGEIPVRSLPDSYQKTDLPRGTIWRAPQSDTTVMFLPFGGEAQEVLSGPFRAIALVAILKASLCYAHRHHLPTPTQPEISIDGLSMEIRHGSLRVWSNIAATRKKAS